MINWPYFGYHHHGLHYLKLLHPLMAFTFWLLFFGTNNHSPSALENESDELTNSLIDDTIYRIRNYSNIDPYHLHKDYELELHQTLGLVPFDLCLSNCHVGIRNGTILGLSRMERRSNGTFGNEGSDLLVNFTLGVENVILDSNISFTIGLFELFSAPIRSYVGSLRIKLLLAVRSRKEMTLKYLRVRHIERVRLRSVNQKEFQSTEVYEFIDIFTNLIIIYFNKFVRKVLSRALFEILSNEIQYMRSH